MNPKLTRIRAFILLAAAAAIVVVLLARSARAQGAPPATNVPGAGPAPAQAPGTPSAPAILRGSVLDPAGKPVPGQRLTLHRVDAGGGAMVDSATSDAQGRFTVRVPAERDTGAVFFVATRWQGQLYIGTPFKPPVLASADYTVVVGVNPVNMGPTAGASADAAPMGATGGAGGAAAQPADSSVTTRWFLAVILALVALGAIAYALLGAARERARERRRELLARIAALDERAQAAGGDEAARLQRERAELLAELSAD